MYYALVYPYLTYGCVLWGSNYETPLAQSVKLHVALRDHIIKLPEIVKFYTCQLFYDHFSNGKPSNFGLSCI